MQFVRRLSLLLSCVLGATTLAGAQSTNDWETLRPEGEEFTISMPKGSSFESVKQPYHKMELNTRLYLSQSPAGPVFAIVSTSGIKSNPAMYTEMQRVNSYVDAFKDFLPAKVRPKTPTARLTLVKETKLMGHPGREYKITIGDLSGTMQAFATRRRFYAVVFLNTKPNEAAQEQFLSSFILPERLPDPPPPPPVAAAAPVASPSPEGGQAQPDAKPGDSPAESTAANTNAAPTTGEPKTDEGDPANATGSKKRRPIQGGILNGKAISLPKPDYPAEAKQAKASGNVVVQVTVDESGIVIDAKAVSGHPLLVQGAVNAAILARFSPTTLMGEPVKVMGVIVYNFVAQ